MALVGCAPTGVEVCFGRDEIIVSKTDTKGVITYANDVFLRVAGYTERELLGKPHNIIRHPDMPACIFKLLWDRIQAGHEVFAYVINLAKNGDHYWVHAHVTPSHDKFGAITGYHSNRRVPQPRVIEGIKDLYGRLRAEEGQHPTRREALAASSTMIEDMLVREGVTYDEYIHGL
jgi:PAS domain S-box-containing protein